MLGQRRELMASGFCIESTDGYSPTVGGAQRLPTHNVGNCSPNQGSVKFLTRAVAPAISNKAAMLEKDVAFNRFLHCGALPVKSRFYLIVAF